MINSDNSVIVVGLENQAIEIGANNQFSKALIQFLFGDLPSQSGVTPQARFEVVAAGKQPMLSLWQGDRRYYFGSSSYQLAYILMNEVIYHCIAGNKTQLAIHAGGIYNDTLGVILPGKSGAGKSMLTAWFLSQNFGYLSDELILLSSDGYISPFTRPISFKTKYLELFPRLCNCRQEEIMADEQGAMVAHRLLNPHFSIKKTHLTHIIFPEYRKNGQTVIQELSPARSCQLLLESYVNARNLPNLGISGLSLLVKQSKTYRLEYNGFEKLAETLQPILSD